MMPPCCWLLVFVWVWWLQLMLVPAEQPQQQGEGCSPKTCGGLTVADPFWLTDLQTGRPCGAFEFEVTCQNNTPATRSSGLLGFAILNISYDDRRLRVVDTSKLDSSNSCDVSTWWNTSVKLRPPFAIDPGNHNLIFYNCTTAAAEVAEARRIPGLVEMRCVDESSSTTLVRAGGVYDATSNYTGYAIEGCLATVLPVLGSSSSSHVANASDYERLLRDGFLLTWDGVPPPLAQ